jgi:hypothetical protein
MRLCLLKSVYSHAVRYPLSGIRIGLQSESMNRSKPSSPNWQLSRPGIFLLDMTCREWRIRLHNLQMMSEPFHDS